MQSVPFPICFVPVPNTLIENATDQKIRNLHLIDMILSCSHRSLNIVAKWEICTNSHCQWRTVVHSRIKTVLKFYIYCENHELTPYRKGLRRLFVISLSSEESEMKSEWSTKLNRVMKKIGFNFYILLFLTLNMTL